MRELRRSSGARCGGDDEEFVADLHGLSGLDEDFFDFSAWVEGSSTTALSVSSSMRFWPTADSIAFLDEDTGDVGGGDTFPEGGEEDFDGAA